MASQTKKKILEAIDFHALEHYLAAFRDPAGCTRCARTIAPAPMPIRDRQGGSRRRQEDYNPDAGAVGRCRIASAAATPLDTWKTWATDVSGAPVDSGHFLTEENPDATAKALKEFLRARDRLERRAETRVIPRKRVSSTPRPFDRSPALWIIAFADDDDGVLIARRQLTVAP